MDIFKRFTKLTKSEPNHKNMNRNDWIIDENKCLNIDEIAKLRKFCDKAREFGLKSKKFTQIRNWLMVELGLNAGLRVEEMASLKHENLLFNGTRSSIVFTGKGNKKRSVWISPDFKKKCLAYFDYKRKFNYEIDDEAYLLNNLKGQKISKRALQKFFKNIVNKAGLSNHFYIHCLRHTYTTFLLKASNNNYRFVQKQLGHASIRTTQVYANVIESEGKKALENLYK